MKHILKIILFILLLLLPACSDAHTSSIQIPSDPISTKPNPVASPASVPMSSSYSDSLEISKSDDITSVIGTWHYIHHETDVMTPDSYILEFIEDGTVNYMSGWENSESMEYRTGSFYDGKGILTITMSTIYITEEGLSYGYSDAEYSLIIAYELSGQELHLTLISGDVPFVYMDYNVELIFKPDAKLQSQRFE